jgi:hypothetical protein
MNEVSKNKAEDKLHKFSSLREGRWISVLAENNKQIVITFEDIPNVTIECAQIPDGYQNLVWDNAWYLHEPEARKYHSKTGFDHAFTGDRKYIGFNFEPNNSITIKNFNSQHPFTFHSFESNSIHRDNLQLYVQGFRRDEQVYGVTTNWRSSFTATLGMMFIDYFHNSRMFLLHNTTHAYIGERQTMNGSPV